MTLLAIILFLPLAGFFLILFTPRDSKAPYGIALVTSLVAFLVSLGLIGPVFASGAQFTSVIDWLWIDSPGLQIHFHLGVDGINLWLILLTTLLLPIGIWVSDTMIADRRKNFFALLLLFEFGLIGVFAALDLFVFYVFWEVALVPMYLMVGGWGTGKRGAAAVKLFVYTMLGSLMMLASIIYLHSQAGTFDYVEIMNALQSGRVILSPTQQLYLFLGFFAALR
jgi:NADH-quinone oxidoreductase subunit M